MNNFLSTLITKKLGTKPLTPRNLAFSLIPYINAVHRSNDQQAKHDMFMAFATGENEESAIKQMNACYKQQKELTDRVVAEMSRQADVQTEHGAKAIFVRMDAADAGYSGLVANKLKSRYGLPIFCLREENPLVWAGSIRSDCDMLDIVNASRLASCHGHQKACGISIKKSNFDKFRQWVNEQDWDIQTTRQVAAELTTDDITLDLCEQLDRYDYLWCNDLIKPQFYVKFDIQPGEQCLCGKAGNTFKYGTYLKFRCNEDEVGQLSANEQKTIEAIVELAVNEYNGVRYPQARIVDWEIATKASNPILDFDSIFN